LNYSNIFLSAANFSIRRELFQELNGFDQRLKDAEDYDLAIRVMQSGRKVFFDKSNLAYHDDFITCRGFIDRTRQYSESQKNLHRLNPGLYGAMTGKEWKPNVLKRIVYSVFSNKRWVRLIDKEKILWIPEKIRYQLYDWVITGLGRVFPDREIE
jgi:GT2 family glycosyltransferase